MAHYHNGPNSPAGGGWQDGNAQTGAKPTIATALWFRMVEQELANVVLASGQQLDEGDHTQLLQAVTPRLAFRNHFVNGDFELWQRVGGSEPSVVIQLDQPDYAGPDRWRLQNSVLPATGSATLTRRRIDPGGETGLPLIQGAPRYKLEWNQTVAPQGTSSVALSQRVEDVHTLAGESVVFSIYAKLGTATMVGTDLSWTQNFGTGGGQSSQVSGVVADQSAPIAGSWARIVIPFTLPALTGKTIGSDGPETSYVEVSIAFELSGTKTGTFEVAYAQLERGSSAAAFEALPPQVRRALAYRYWYKSYEEGAAPGSITSLGQATGHDEGVLAQELNTRFPVPMRAVPTVTWYDPTALDASAKILWGGQKGVVGQHEVSSVATGFPEIAAGVGNIPVHAHFKADAEL